jgi:hypothetical protein
MCLEWGEKYLHTSTHRPTDYPTKVHCVGISGKLGSTSSGQYIPYLMKPRISLPCSQKPAIEPCPEPDRSTRRSAPHYSYSKNSFKMISKPSPTWFFFLEISK